MQTSLLPAAGIIALMGLMVGVSAAATQSAPHSSTAEITAAEAWAFPKWSSPDPSLPKALQARKLDLHAPLHVPGSTRTYTRAQMDTRFGVVDWFPQDHPPMPHIVAYGHKPAWACGACHKPGGEGYPSSASLAGLPEAYILEQISAFRHGERGTGPWPSMHDMVREARWVTDADERAAVQYFSKLKFKSHDKVVETTTVPETHWVEYVLEPDESGAREPLDERIIETAANPKDDELDDARVVYIAYVPPGSIEAGAKIAAKGVGTAPSCESCHGADLQGAGDIPYLAGRSPTYIVRELVLFRLGRRTNPQAAPMRAEVAHLTLKDMIDVAAYAASRKS